MHVESLNALRRSQPTSHPGYVIVLKSALEEAIAELSPRTMKLEKILRHVTTAFGVSADDIRSIRRQDRIRDARFAFCFLARKLTTKSYPEIGMFLGKDHSTIIYGDVRGQSMVLDSELFRDRVAETEAAILAELDSVDAMSAAA